MKKLLFLINPLSGKTEGQKIEGKLIPILKNHLPSKEYDIVATEPDMLNQLSHIRTDYEKVVAAGGDGTIANIIQVMVSLGWKQKIGIIPLGTGNDLARSLGLLKTSYSDGLESLIKIILKGKTKQLDILEVNNWYTCINYFGVGSDAGILRDFEGIRKDVSNQYLFRWGMGKLVYAFLGLRHLNDKISPGTEFLFRSENNKEVYKCFDSGICAILISNISSYGGGTCPSSKAQIDDGLFEVTVIKNIKEWVLLHLARFTGKPVNIICPGINQFQTDRVELSFPESTFCQIDGEIISGLSETKKKITVRVKSQVDMIVP